MNKQICIIYICLFLLVYLTFSWFYKLGTLPGLHGDEAWVGLKAYAVYHGGEPSFLGMNNYTGSLQILLSAGTFNFFPVDVFSLRLGGVILNLLSLICVLFVLNPTTRWFCFLVFLALLSQSSLFVTSPRIAWEINSFTLFLISLLALAAAQILKHNFCSKCWFWILVFLQVNIVGSYSHVIFSSISLSFLVGIVLWTIFFGDFKNKNWIILFIFNVVNSGLLFIYMKFFHLPTNSFPIIVFIIFLVLLLEVPFIFFLFFKKVPFVITGNIAKKYIAGLLFFELFVFLFFHGKAFFEVLSVYKVFMQFYSFESTVFLKNLLIATSACYVFYLLKFMWDDLSSTTRSSYVFVLISFCGILTMYTTQTSFRYYMIIYLITTAYLTLKINHLTKMPVPLAISTVITFGIIIYFQFQIFSRKEFSARPIIFNIGNNQRETSAHFLQKEPLVKYIHENQVSKLIIKTDNNYFISEPIKFYETIDPWNKNLSRVFTITYDYDHFGSGFKLVPISPLQGN